eukprot:TRINITY_DN12666_c0_g1_i1.p1 TRINITY_DN12666_c0_g1~~TRINITY_DN12666_c0_g1_i1.p1  ORF type:complete len:211 (-),score=41.96 TRINITY_DN12666_c0_g1_i1:233-865(-)
MNWRKQWYQRRVRGPNSDLPNWWNTSLWGPWDGFSHPFSIGPSLLAPQFYCIIQEWLGYPRSWCLIFRASRDGSSSSNFHGLCDGMGSTVTIVRAGGYFFGGYASSSWNGTSGYITVENCFLFTLTNAWNHPPTPFYCTSPSYGMHCYSGHGPTWGGGYDLQIASNCCHSASSHSNFPFSYRDTVGYGNHIFAGSRNFVVQDYEVFCVSS